VFVVVDRGRDTSVVFVPLSSLDLAISVPVTEVLEKLKEDLVFGHFTTLDLGVHAAVVDTAEVSSGDNTITVSVELEESLVNHSLSPLVTFSADTDKELVEVDATIAISIEK